MRITEAGKMIFTSARSASDSLASSDSSSPFASGAASFEFPRSDHDEKLFQDDDESDMYVGESLL